VSGHGVLLLAVGLFWLSVALAVGADATRRGRQGGVWGVTAFLLGPFGILLYVLVILGTMAGAGSGGSDSYGGSIDRVCPTCETGHTESPDRCRECGEPLGPEDEPRSARLLRSGSRGYCGDCKSRVDLDSTACPNCGAAF
jgi:RNA polymerase subunit RPABC4/transcription elongation factor Spt4